MKMEMKMNKKNEEVSCECEQNPLIAKIINNGIRIKEGRKAFLPHRLSQDAFDQLAAFSYEFLKDGEGNGGDNLDYDAVTYCVFNILDYQQNGETTGEVITDRETINEAIGMYCLTLQFELITRTKILNLSVSRPTLSNIFDKHRKLEIDGKYPKSFLDFSQKIENVAPVTIETLKNIIRTELVSLSDIKDNVTVH